MTEGPPAADTRWMRAFVAGATGYTGREVVRQLAERSIDVVAHVRPDSPSLEQWRTRFVSSGARVDATPWTAADMQRTLERLRPTHVFALLGTTRKRARQARAQGGSDSYETIDYGLTATLLNATVAARPDARFVYLSALGVNGQSRNPYIAVRWRLESELKRSGLCWLIARPALITGEDREESRPTEKIAAVAVKLMLGGAGALGLRSFRDRFATLDARQLGRALVTAALGEECDVTLDVPQLLALAQR